MNNPILFVGPIGEPRTGQSLSSDTWLKHTSHQVFVIDTNTQGCSALYKLTTFFSNFGVLFYICLFHRSLHLYISPKRSLLGGATDFIYIYLHYVLCNGDRVAHIHGADFDDVSDKKFKRILFRVFFFPINRVLTLTQSMAHPYKHIAKKVCIVVNNFCTEEITPIEIQNKVNRFSSESRFQVLFLSNIIHSKGVENLIFAIDELLKSGESFHLHLAGRFVSDEYKSAKQMKNILSAHSQSVNITYHGIVSGDAKRQLLLRAHALALPTFYKSEAQPLAILEGLCAGCSIVTTRHNYNEEFLSDFSINFCRSNDILTLKSSLLSSKIQFAHAADEISSNYRKAKDRFSVKRFVSTIDDIFVVTK